MRGRAYRLSSTWRLDAPVEHCWAALADPVFSWPRWWPGVTTTGVHSAPDGLVGSAADVVFRSPLRYHLAMHLEVEEARPSTEVRLRASGDLVGHALARLTTAAPGRTRIDVLWHVTPTVTWMIATGALLAPAFAGAHAAMMRSGERGLARYLAGRAGADPG